MSVAFNMKVLIVFFICIVAVFGEEEIGEREKKIYEILTKASRQCIQELKLDPSLINDKGPSMDDEVNENGCYIACVDRKFGVLNEDGTYSLERMLAFEDTPEKKKRAEKAYNQIAKECNSPDNKDPCKMAACFHNIVKNMALKNEW